MTCESNRRIAIAEDICGDLMLLEPVRKRGKRYRDA